MIIGPDGETYDATSEDEIRGLYSSIITDEADDRVAWYADIEKVKARLRKKGYKIKHERTKI